MTRALQPLRGWVSVILFLASVAGLGAAREVSASTTTLSQPPRGHLSGVLNVNTASTRQFELLPGIGPAIAARIVEYRTRRPFRSLAQLMRVKGVGRKTFSDIRPYLTLTEDTNLSAAP